MSRLLSFVLIISSVVLPLPSLLALHRRAGAQGSDETAGRHGADTGRLRVASDGASTDRHAKDEPAETATPPPPPRRLAAIYSETRTLSAALIASLCYASMVFQMTAVPLAMVGGTADGAAHLFSFEQSSLVVQIHMVSIFAPSFVIGHLVRKFGVPAVQTALPPRP